MKIELSMPDGYKAEPDVKEGIEIEELYREYEDKSPYTCIAAKVDNEYQSLKYKVDKPCRVELLDIRDRGACRVYQAGICMVFVAAARKILGDVECVIANTLAHGLFIELKNTDGATDEMAEKIRNEMQSIIDRDVLFRREYLSREESLKHVKETGDRQRLKLISSMPEIKGLELYESGSHGQRKQMIPGKMATA